VLAVLWGIPCAIGGAVLGLYRASHGGYELHWIRSPADLVRFVVFFAAAWGATGALHGFAFAGVLATLGRRAGPRALRPLRVAGWGAVAGLIPASVYLALLAASTMDLALMPGGMVLILGGAALGGLCALGTLWLAGGPTRLAPPTGSDAPAA